MRRLPRAQNGIFRFVKTQRETRAKPRLTSKVPSYRRHKQSGQAIVTIQGRDYLLGPHGSKASRANYDRLIAEWLARGRQPEVSAETGLTVAELAARYWAYAKERHTKDGRPTPELGKVKATLPYILRLYENHLATEFGPLQLKVVRQSMMKADWARSYINQQMAVLVRMFKFGATEGLIPAAVHAALDLVDGLRRGESTARETDKVRPVEDAAIEVTLPHLSPTVRAMIELQRATGARPGEICILRPMDVDRGEAVWQFVPESHKTAHHGHDRCIYIGPKGQDILRPFLLRAADAYCFSPRKSADWHRAERFANRKTPANQGNSIGSKRKRAPKRTPRDSFDVCSYRRAISRGCDIAFPAPEGLDAEAVAKWQAEHRWAPNQLRHAAATQIRKEFGIDAVKAMLGHSSTNMSGHYAELDRQRAVEVARKIG